MQVTVTITGVTPLLMNRFTQLVDDAGKKIGLGDYRPQRKGPFGRYVVTKWEVVKGTEKR